MKIFETTFPRPLGEYEPDAALVALLQPGSSAPVRSDDAIRGSIRALLRAGGFKPSGRSKPASEYLVRASGEGNLGSINLAVDVCNVVSLHSGLPITVVDIDLARPPFHIEVCPKGASYIFNRSGQELDLGGLICLHDADGPCGSPVKDSQRTKTHAGTLRTLSVVWAPDELAEDATRWYHELLRARGAQVTERPE